MTATKKAMNRLDRRANRKLEDFILSRKSAIAAGEYTMARLLSVSTDEVGCPVKITNLKAAAKLMDVPLPRATGMGGNSPLTTARQLRAGIKLLAYEPWELKGRLGEVASPTLKALAEDDPPMQQGKFPL